MTKLVEEITIKITIDHCNGDSEVLGGKYDLRAGAALLLAANLGNWIAERHTQAVAQTGAGIHICFANTGLYEVPEECGGDN